MQKCCYNISFLGTVAHHAFSSIGPINSPEGQKNINSFSYGSAWQLCQPIIMSGPPGQLTRAIALIGRQRSQISARCDGLVWRKLTGNFNGAHSGPVGSRFMFIGSDLRSVLQHIDAAIGWTSGFLVAKIIKETWLQPMIQKLEKKPNLDKYCGTFTFSLLVLPIKRESKIKSAA